MNNAVKEKEACTAATVQAQNELNQIQDNYTLCEEDRQMDLEYSIDMIRFGLDAIECIQVALAEGGSVTNIYEHGLYYLTTRLKEEVEQFHKHVLDLERKEYYGKH